MLGRWQHDTRAGWSGPPALVLTLTLVSRDIGAKQPSPATSVPNNRTRPEKALVSRALRIGAARS